MVSKTDKRLFKIHTGSLLVKFVELDVEKEVFGNEWTVLTFILTAWKIITGEDRRELDEREEAKNWRMVRCYFYEDDGVVEAKMEGGIS